MDHFNKIFLELLNASWTFSDDINLIPKNKNVFKAQIISYIKDAVEHKNEDHLSTLILLAEQDGIDKDYHNLLCQILKMRWHGCHEDILLIIADLKDPEYLNCIEDCLEIEKDADEYDPIPITKKCIWALGAIGTEKAQSVLEKIFSTSRNIEAQTTANLELKKLQGKR